MIWWAGSLLEELLPRVATFFPAGVSNPDTCQVNTQIGFGWLPCWYPMMTSPALDICLHTLSFWWMMFLILFIPSWPLLRFAVRPVTGDRNCRALKSFITIDKLSFSTTLWILFEGSTWCLWPAGIVACNKMPLHVALQTQRWPMPHLAVARSGDKIWTYHKPKVMSSMKHRWVNHWWSMNVQTMSDALCSASDPSWGFSP